MSADTIEKLTKLFEISHSPSSALNTIKYELQVQYGDNHVHASVDRSICPDLQFCFKLYHKLFKEACVASYIEEKIDDSNEHLDNGNIITRMLCFRPWQCVRGHRCN